MEVEDQETSCFGALAQTWARARREGGGVNRKRQSVGFLPSRSCVLFSLDRDIPFSPCLPGPCLPGPAGAPPCGYGLVQMIVVCAMRQNQMCLLGAGVGVFQGSPLPLLVLMPVPELHPSPHNSIPPSNLPARGVTPCSFFNPGYYPGSWPERDPAFP